MHSTLIIRHIFQCRGTFCKIPYNHILVSFIRVVIKAGTGNEETGNEEMKKRGNEETRKCVNVQPVFVILLYLYYEQSLTIKHRSCLGTSPAASTAKL